MQTTNLIKGITFLALCAATGLAGANVRSPSKLQNKIHKVNFCPIKLPARTNFHPAKLQMLSKPKKISRNKQSAAKPVSLQVRSGNRAKLKSKNLAKTSSQDVSGLGSRSKFVLTLKAGVSVNKGQEKNLIRRLVDNSKGRIKSLKTTSDSSAAFHLDFMHQPDALPYFAWGVNTFFMPAYKIKTIAHFELPRKPLTIGYLNTSISSYGFMVKLQLQKTVTPFSFYISGGLGPVLNRIKTSPFIIQNEEATRPQVLFNKSKLNLGWQIGIGTKYDINDKVGIDIGYVYLDRGKVSTKDLFDEKGDKVGPLLILRPDKKASFEHLISHQVLMGLSLNI